MLSMIFNSVGIASSVIGTILTLWKIFTTKKDCVGTWEEIEERPLEFPREKRCVIIGSGFIILGGLMQIVSQFIS